MPLEMGKKKGGKKKLSVKQHLVLLEQRVLFQGLLVLLCAHLGDLCGNRQQKKNSR